MPTVEVVIAPPSVSVPKVTVAVGVPESVTAPVPRLRLEGPTYPKLPWNTTGLFVASVTAVPLELPSVVLAATVSVPVPIAFALWRLSWPTESVVGPA